MEKITFNIGPNTHEVSIVGSPSFDFGKEVTLSNKKNDITFDQSWYQKGYESIDFMTKEEFKLLYDRLTVCVKNIIEDDLGLSTPDDFTLEKYHQIVTSDADHYKVVGKTRDLFPEDFEFPIDEIIPKFEKILGIPLTDIDPFDGSKLHIIIRINRPLSTDFNPPHKDIYEGVDNQDNIPQFVNLWIPIAGVTENSSLPIVPFSHLIPENKILRTFEGAMVEGKKYHVRMIREWDGSTSLERAKVDYGQVLFFTSHLVHGLAVNEETDTTRVAFEFRLFKKN
jgi:hypothetical protein